ncbi:hypothetical protein V2J09_016535 [Rumex salicifolius]
MACSKAFLLFFTFLLVSSQPGVGQGLNLGKNPISPVEDSARMKTRKLLEELVQLDYDYAGPNPKHNPRRGGGSRNP